MCAKRLKQVTVVVADDHAVLRKGLRDLINEEAGFTVVGEAGNGEEALEKVEALKPEIVILDIDMPVRSGLEVGAELKRRRSTARLIALSMYDEERIFDRAMDIGFDGYLLKDGAIGDIVAAMTAVMAGKYYITPALSTFALSRAKKVPSAGTPTLALLTQTERKVLRLIAEHKSTKEAAEALFVSPRTIDSHRANIAQKLGLKGPNALLRWAVENRGKM